MRSGFTAVCAILLGGSTLVAQGSGQSHGVAGISTQDTAQGPVTLIEHGSLPACPVSMRAQHVSDGSMVKTQAGHRSGVGQWLHLTVVSEESKQVAKATLTVRGFSAQGHVTDAGNAKSAQFNAVRTLTAAFVADEDHSATADFWVPGMTAVQRIDLRSLEYVDGSTWKTGNDASCHVDPDPLMLITSR